ncbi:EAL domain-containing protein [Thalassomonas viridans]|uniref:EAL domain-containing protein n=1 Tax=Thalassomonas viridans TaxID=137584 RepID=A0AAE9Z8C8_9GAMM|nr:EAL domain-containing protein [Thalassomonas viridans]WDE08571.1 EAL domain-containing protein [Thalassomonas viridans]
MSIKTYLALLVWGCLAGGYALEQYLMSQGQHIQSLENKLKNEQLWAKDVTRINNALVHFLTSADLILGSGNTYLLYGNSRISHSLINDLDITASLHPDEKRLSSVREHIEKINILVNQVSLAKEEELERLLPRLLERHDVISDQLVQIIELLAQETNDRIDEIRESLVQEQQQDQYTNIIARLAFLIFILTSWYWANRKISKPLHCLQESSKTALSGRSFYPVKSAPSEIMSLSNDIDYLVGNLKYQADRDPLTGLYNRRLLMEHINRSILLAKRNPRTFGLLYFDLDGFKLINDSQGHSFGDSLLKVVSEQIGQLIRKSDIFARMGGDEFIIYFDDINEASELANLAARILNTFAPGFYIRDQLIKVTASIGITIYPENGDTAERLICNADSALYNAKNAGRNCYLFYSEKMYRQVRERLEIESDIRNALKNDEFELHYQPKVDANGQVKGAEALLRWQHPLKGNISPAVFIPVAEKSDLIVKIGAWVREKAFHQLALWKKQHFPPIRLSVNVAGQEFTRNTLLQHLITLFQKYDVDQHLLELEITEGTLMESVEQSLMDFRIIKNMDVHISIDDFGTGYCSLGYLKNYPIQTLKIDKSFIDGILINGRDTIITKTVIAMAKSLDMEIVAEGVEKEEQRDFLFGHGCDLIQGYYYSPPLPLAEFEAYVGSMNREGTAALVHT